ncbi:MAG: DUF92 domain-containing protein [Anaerolineae bacterium]|nr:DUF92 domain-containing protein [Anaerolineae bacterium]
MKILWQSLWGILISGLIGLAAYRRGSLARSGVVGAMIVGTAIFGFGGWVWGALLIVFFVLSSALSHYKAAAKADLAEKFDKGHRRDLGQALANGGAGALIAVAFLFYPQPVLLAAFVGAMAAVNADTWATELGVLSKRPPRLITTWRIVEAGSSGGVSLPGTLAALAGALAIGLVAAIMIVLDGLLGGSVNALLGADGLLGGTFLFPAAALGGLAGSLFDSVLGATVQAIYYSPARHKETEKKVDPGGAPNLYRRGWPWLTNDWVNFLSSLVGAAIGALAWITIHIG